MQNRSVKHSPNLYFPFLSSLGDGIFVKYVLSIRLLNFLLKKKKKIKRYRTAPNYCGTLLTIICLVV